jgi:hypothetical protein
MSSGTWLELSLVMFLPRYRRQNLPHKVCDARSHVRQSAIALPTRGSVELRRSRRCCTWTRGRNVDHSHGDERRQRSAFSSSAVTPAPFKIVRSVPSLTGESRCWRLTAIGVRVPVLALAGDRWRILREATSGSSPALRVWPQDLFEALVRARSSVTDSGGLSAVQIAIKATPNLGALMAGCQDVSEAPDL